MLTLAASVSYGASTAVIAGEVRDTQGVAQMGAMVQVLAMNSARVATAFTDIYGRYRITDLLPGQYQVRATAALFVPATRNNLRLSTGMRATVNLTLGMLSDPAVWLPAKPRGPQDAGDDWTWTLRSTANRPILRLQDDGTVVLVSSPNNEQKRQPTMRKRASVVGGNGGFGFGGGRSVLALDRTALDGSDIVLRTSLGMRHGQGFGVPMEVDAGYQRKGFGDASRIVVSYATHPEIVTGRDTEGLDVLRIASAEKMQLGDLADVEAGATVYAIHMAGTILTDKPFVRVTVHPGEVWAVQYRMATSRDLQDYAGLDDLASAVPTAVMADGKMQVASGVHQELAVSRKAGAGKIQAAVYHDAVDRSELTGTGAVTPSDVIAAGDAASILLDSATGAFRFLGAGYTANGVDLMISQPLTPSLQAALEVATGQALEARNTEGEQLAAVTAGLHNVAAQEITASLNGHVLRTGTRIHAAYRWEAGHLVTAVAPFSASNNQAYLSFYVRQAVRWGNKLPAGLEATLDVTNLLAQGYQPFLSADGRTLYLAQSPRTIQAGLSLKF